MNDLQKNKILRGLNQTAIFRNLPDDVLIKLSEKAGLEAYVPEDVIVWEGDPSDRLFITINGIVTVKKIIPGKSDKIFAYLLPGSTFGEVGILENKPRSATVSALTDVEVLVFDREYFLKILHDHPTVAIELAILLGHYLTESNKRLTRGDKEKKVVIVFDVFQTHGATELGKRLALQLKNNTDQETIYAEYPFRNSLSAELELPIAKHDVFHHDSGVDILLERKVVGGETKMALMMDNLLNSYENLIIYLNKDFDEDASQILENIDQIIVVGSNDQSHWDEISNIHKSIKLKIENNDTKIFTILIDDETKDKFIITPQPDFEIVFYNKSADYKLWSDDNAQLASATFDETVVTLVDRLQRNNNISVFIPTTIDVNIYFDTTPFIERTLAFLGERFGGATSEEVKGVWNSEEIGLVGETLFKVHTYATSRDLNTYLDEVVDFIREIKLELKQEAMAMEINQKLTLV